jgi:hypothetical protein
MMWGRLTVSLLDQGGEESHHFVAMVEDITDRKQAESDSREREAELEVIAGLSLAMRQATSLAEVVESLVERAAPALSARACGLLLLEDHTLRLVASRGLTGAPGSMEIPDDDSLAWQVIRSGQIECRPHAVYDTVSTTADPIRSDPICTLDPNASLVVLAPLRSSDVTLGLVFLAFDQVNELSPGVRKLLNPVSDIASNAIQRAKLLQTLEQQVSDRTRRLKLLYEVSAAATAAGAQSVDLYSMLLSALETLVAAMPGSAGGLLLLDDETSCRPPSVHYGLSTPSPLDSRSPGRLDAPAQQGRARSPRARLAAEGGLAGVPGRAHPGNQRDSRGTEPFLAFGTAPDHR